MNIWMKVRQHGDVNGTDGDSGDLDGMKMTMAMSMAMAMAIVLKFMVILLIFMVIWKMLAMGVAIVMEMMTRWW